MTLSHRYMARQSYALLGVIAEHVVGKPDKFHDLCSRVRLALQHAAARSAEGHIQASAQAMACIEWDRIGNLAAVGHLSFILGRDKVSVALQAVDGHGGE